MVELEERQLSSQFVKVPDTNFHCPSTSRTTKFAKVLEIPLPQREWIWSGYINHIYRTCAYSFHQVSSQSLYSKYFPRFPPPTPPPPQYHQIWAGFKKSSETQGLFKYQISFKI